MKRIDYDGPLWREREPAPELAALLRERDALIELSAAGGGPGVVLGVPHHAGPGVDEIAERRPEGGRVADENAVMYALAGFAALRERGAACRLVVAAHASDHDPNKHPERPYCQRALSSGAELLLECHGAGFPAPHPLEVSAGRNARAEPLRFGRLLSGALGAGLALAAQARPGERAARRFEGGAPLDGEVELKFPALKTRSLAEADARGLAALHLEATPRFRTFGVQGMRLTDDGARLGRALAEAVVAYLAGGPTGRG